MQNDAPPHRTKTKSHESKQCRAETQRKTINDSQFNENTNAGAILSEPRSLPDSRAFGELVCYPPSPPACLPTMVTTASKKYKHLGWVGWGDASFGCGATKLLCCFHHGLLAARVQQEHVSKIHIRSCPLLGLRSLDHGPLTIVRGPWPLDHDLWTMVQGPMFLYQGPLSLGAGLWIIVSGTVVLDHGPYARPLGQWSPTSVNNGP